MEFEKTLSNTAFIINFINLCIGIGLLAKPYAISIAGWYSILSVCMAFTFITYAGYLIGKITMNHVNEEIIDYEIVNNVNSTSAEVSSDEEEDESINQAECNNKSIFQILGYKAFGKYGEYYINISLPTIIIIYFVQIIIIEFELCSRIIQCLFVTKSITVYLNDEFIFIYIFIITLPFIFTSNWKQLTFIGAISVISVITVALTIFTVYILSVLKFDGDSIPSSYYDNQSLSNYNTQNDAIYVINNISLPVRIFMSFILFKGGVCGILGIPSMIISLKDRSLKNIIRLIFVSYLIVMTISVLFGIIGAQIYQENVSVLILNNLFIWPSGIIIQIVTIIEIINLCSSYGMYASIVFSIIDSLLNIHTTSNIKKYLMRSCFQISIFFIAYLFRYHLAFITTMLHTIHTSFSGALMLPLVLYIGIFYHKIKLISKIFHICLLFVIVAIAFTVLVYSKNLVV